MCDFVFEFLLVSIIMWIIFQHQVAELRSLGAQLDNVAVKADAASRDRCRLEHEKLTDRAVIIQRKAAERQPTVARCIDSWNEFNQQWKDVNATVDDVKSNLPEVIDVTSDVSVLRQQMQDCEDAVDKLQTEKPHINDVMQQGSQILESVSSVHIHSQVNNLADSLQSLTDKSNSDLQRYFVLWILLYFQCYVCQFCHFDFNDFCLIIQYSLILLKTVS